MIVRKLALLLLITSVFVSCSEVRKLTDSISNATAREIYQRELKSEPQLLQQWNSNYTSALRDSLEIVLPYGEKGSFTRAENVAHSYDFSLTPGRKLIVEIQSDSVTQLTFLDLFQYDGTQLKNVQRNEKDISRIEFATEVASQFKLVIQPEMAAASSFYLSIYEEPLYGFPVAGKGNSHIQSFWGNVRDGGQRTHEGIDVFAAKGTPIVAVTDGRIGFTGEKGLGGKQVWLRSKDANHSLYYAHLDSIWVASGVTVKKGDTLGSVGNTGNAKFTPPHLHFGIYQGYGGAVDPLPFVYQLPRIEQSQFPKNFAGPFLKINTSKANLRSAPNTQSKIVGGLVQKDTVLLLGQSKDWLYIRTMMGQKAFLYKGLAEKL